VNGLSFSFLVPFFFFLFFFFFSFLLQREEKGLAPRAWCKGEWPVTALPLLLLLLLLLLRHNSCYCCDMLHLEINALS